MTASIMPVDTFDLVVFGGTGDLALRKLLPGLYYRDRDRQLSPDSRIIGVARSRIDREAYAREVEAALRRHLPAHDLEDECFLGRLDYVALDAIGAHGWAELAAKLARADDRVRVFYLATAPDLFGQPRRGRSTTRSAPCSPRSGSSGSITTSARRRSRI